LSPHQLIAYLQIIGDSGVDICLHFPKYKDALAVRPRHPNKEIESAVAYAEAHGWTWKKATGHAWARLLCAHHDRDGCQISVWSTPKVPEHHARAIMRAVDRCPHAV
jgi:hypothetical protein